MIDEIMKARGTISPSDRRPAGTNGGASGSLRHGEQSEREREADTKRMEALREGLIGENPNVSQLHKDFVGARPPPEAKSDHLKLRRDFDDSPWRPPLRGNSNTGSGEDRRAVSHIEEFEPDFFAVSPEKQAEYDAVNREREKRMAESDAWMDARMRKRKESIDAADAEAARRASSRSSSKHPSWGNSSNASGGNRAAGHSPRQDPWAPPDATQERIYLQKIERDRDAHLSANASRERSMGGRTASAGIHSSDRGGGSQKSFDAEKERSHTSGAHSVDDDQESENEDEVWERLVAGGSLSESNKNQDLPNGKPLHPSRGRSLQFLGNK
jgi:hypothetical protein